MDYKEKYENAIGRAKAAHGTGAYDDATMEFLFPELAESEDERIRKHLIEIVETYWGKTNDHGKAADLAWLEKQKENPKSADSIPSDCTSDVKYEDRWHKVANSLPDNGRDVLAKDALGNFLLASFDGDRWYISGYDNEDKPIVYTPAIEEWCDIPSEKQKEPKPIIQDVELNDAVYDYVRDHFIAGADFTPEYIKKLMENAFFAGVDYYLLKQEWSEDDEKHLIWLCRIIHSRVVNKELSLAEESEFGKWIDKWINHEPQPVQKWDEFDEDCLKRAVWYVENPAPSVVKDTNLALWLKSLSGRFNLEPKQEWSEEDEKKMIFLERLIEHNVPDGQYGWVDGRKGGFVTKSEAISMLKSLRPVGKESLQSHWKPSEDEERLINTSISFLKDFADNGYENAVECIDWLKSKLK